MTRHLDNEVLAGFGELRGEARRQALEHLRSCAGCRSEWASRDPSRMFALLAVEPLPPEILNGVSAGVASTIRQGRSSASAPPRGSRWLAAGALAAGLVLAALLGIQLSRSPVRQTTELPPDRFPQPPRAHVELLSPESTAQVFDLSVGDTQVVMIFDEELEL